MSTYWALFRTRFCMFLQYRAAALGGFCCQLFWGWINLMIFDAFYRSTTAPQPMSYAQVVSYIWLGQALFRLIPWGVDGEIMGMIRSGNVSYELLRPLDLYAFWYSRVLAWQTSATTLRAVPMFVIALLFFGLQLPASPSAAGAFLLAILVSVLLGCAMSVVLTITLMWTISGDGISQLIGILTFIFSGIIIPLPFYPDWVQTILNFLPFRSLFDVPFRLYMGHIPVEHFPIYFIQQIFWLVTMFLFGRWLLSRGVRRLELQGG